MAVGVLRRHIAGGRDGHVDMILSLAGNAVPARLKSVRRMLPGLEIRTSWIREDGSQSRQ